MSFATDLLAPALALLQARALRLQAEDVGRRLDQPVLEELRPRASRPGPRCRRRCGDTKWRSRSTAWAAQISPPVQRRTASPGSRTARLPQTGTVVRELVGLGVARPLLQRRPRRPAGSRRRRAARSRVSPTRTSLRAISSSLCRVALRDHDAADRDRLQLGHRRQRAGAADLDVDVLAARSRACSAGNLWAIAQRGARLTKPSRCCQSRRSTL